jgi:predicted nucleic acid-binding protein
VIVLDASAALAATLGGPDAQAIQDRLGEVAEVHVPEHFHVEALSGLRRLSLRGGLDEVAARRALRAIMELRALRHFVLPLFPGIWARRDNLSAYDAAYLALAERLDADLLTVDRGLAIAAKSEGRFAMARVPVPGDG